MTRPELLGIALALAAFGWFWYRALTVLVIKGTRRERRDPQTQIARQLEALRLKAARQRMEQIDELIDGRRQ